MSKTKKAEPSKAEAIKALRVAKADPMAKAMKEHGAIAPDTKVGDDLSDPKHPLNRTNGKSKAEIAAKVDELIARDKSRHARGITSPAPKADNLTDADRKAIAEITAKAKKAVKTTARIAKLKGDTAKMPLEGKAALAALKSDAKPKREKLGKQPRQLKVAKPLAKKAGEKGDTVFRAGSKKEAAFKLLCKKAGASQPELHKLTGWPHTNVRELAQQSKMKLVEKDGRFWLQ